MWRSVYAAAAANEANWMCSTLANLRPIPSARGI